jgi:phage-related protein
VFCSDQWRRIYATSCVRFLAGDTIYAAKFEMTVDVLHVFQKKSKRGIATPKQEIDLVRDRLKIAERLHREAAGKVRP